MCLGGRRGWAGGGWVGGLYLAVLSSASGCCLWRLEHWILREMTLFGAQCLARLWIRSLRQSWLLDDFPRFLVALLALGIWTLFPRRFVADWWFDGDGHFCSIFAAFSGSSSELSLPGQCTGTGPCIICLSDLHRRGADVLATRPSPLVEVRP